MISPNAAPPLAASGRGAGTGDRALSRQRASWGGYRASCLPRRKYFLTYLQEGADRPQRRAPLKASALLPSVQRLGRHRKVTSRLTRRRIARDQPLSGGPWMDRAAFVLLLRMAIVVLELIILILDGDG
jgi:hypothetical protein